MKLTINGECQEMDAETIGQILVGLGLEKTPCAVELNRTLVPARERTDHQLNDGDILEIVTLVGGG